MNIRNRPLSSAILLGIATLSGCGGSSTGEQDVGSTDANSTQSRAFYARAVDGYLAGATAYIDRNENGRLDAFEPRAITDRDGFFSYNHVTGTDYCASTAAELSQHCLRGSFAPTAELLVRVTGGYDTVTGLPFKGTLSLRSSELDRDDLRLVTPQTSVAAAAGSAQGKLDLLARAGILGVTGSLDEDHIGSALSAQAIRAQLATYLVRMFGIAADTASPVASFDELQVDAWHLGYVAIAQRLAEHHAQGGSGEFRDVFAAPSTLGQIVRQVAYSHAHPGQPVPASFTLANESAMQPLLRFSADLVELGEELITAAQASSISPAQLTASLRVLAVAAERGLDDPLDPELTDLFAWVRKEIAQPGGLGADLSGLGAEHVDLQALIDRAFDFEPDSDSISARAIIPMQAARAFASIANTSFRASVKQADERGDGLIFVVGPHGARAGEVQMCVRYRDDSGDFDTTTSSDSNGALLVGGRWNLLNDHTLTLNVDIVGGVRPLIVKSTGVSGADLQYRFDFGGDLSEWTGAAPAGFATGAVPSNDAECRAALLREFGSMD